MIGVRNKNSENNFGNSTILVSFSFNKSTNSESSLNEGNKNIEMKMQS